MSKNIAGILLAAGHSVRFGSDKLLHPLNKGNAMVEQSAQRLLQACPNSLAVIQNKTSGPGTLLAATGLSLIENHQPQLGMGSSIACGVSATADADAWLICLADMPFIQVETYETILQNLQDTKAIFAPTYQGQRGHPVLFSKHFIDDLSSLNSDTGARNIISCNKDHLRLIELNDPGILQDIDKMSDFDQFDKTGSQ